MTAPQQHGERVRRVPRQEVRRRLLDAASETLLETGYAAASVEMIAARAGFSKGAVYSNFGGKPDLFAAVLQDRAGAERERLLAESIDRDDVASESMARIVAEEITSDDSRSRLGVEFAAHAVHDDSTREVWTAMRRSQRDVAEKAITEVTSRAASRLATDARTAALILHCLTNGLALEHLADPEQVDAEVIEKSLAYVIGALTPGYDSAALTATDSMSTLAPDPFPGPTAGPEPSAGRKTNDAVITDDEFEEQP